MDRCSCGIFRRDKSSSGKRLFGDFTVASMTRMPAMSVGKTKMHSFCATRALSSSSAIRRIVSTISAIHLELISIDATLHKSIGNSRITGLLALPCHREWAVLTTQLIVRIAMIDRSVKQFPSNHLPEIVLFKLDIHCSFLRSDVEWVQIPSSWMWAVIRRIVSSSVIISALTA